jgi:DNA-binding beta-propeller fold protein YncE
LDLEGNVIYDSGSSVEELAVRMGQYPDNRSDKRGVEIEGATVAKFGEQEFAFVASERGSFVVAYDISDVKNPKFVGFMPTGMSPEGVLAIPKRNLLLTANEGDGTIDIFQAATTVANAYTEQQPLVMSESQDLPFSAFSGLQTVPGGSRQLYAVPDSAIAPSRIFTLNVNGGKALVSRTLMITKDGKPMSYDLEGITLNPAGGFWLVSEGDDREGQQKPNLLLKVSDRGTVEEEIPLPQEAAAIVTRFWL